VEESWGSLEIVKLIVGVLTPISVAVFGWFISRRLKRFELIQWSNQKIIEKRLSLFDLISPKLNDLLCFFTWVGDWKNISPDDVLKIKRELDKFINIYRHLFDEDVYNTYQDFIHSLFLIFQGAGEDAKIRSNILGPNGDRTSHCLYTWQQKWNDRFTEKDAILPINVIRNKYYVVMNALRKSVGI
jgi:hypothetical protein